MNWFDALLLGVLEGITEFLPVSSTGHLILLGEHLGHHDDAAKTLEIVIQLGAVLAVVVYYRRILAGLVRGMIRRDPASLRLALALAIAFAPAAVAGLLLHKWIKEQLFGPGPVAVALIVGGVVMIGIESLQRARGGERLGGTEHVTPRRALAIGLAQCVSLWPGASRSMSTIVGGQLCGLSTATAAEFSFLLAIPTLGAATLFDLAKNGKKLLEAPGGVLALGVGMVVAFAVALLVIAAFLRYLRRFGLIPFGAYRIVLGIAVLLLVTSAPKTAQDPRGASTLAPHPPDASAAPASPPPSSRAAEPASAPLPSP
jgi:undecaprenyl-diphosphatase